MARADERTLDELITLVHGATFVVSTRNGEIHPDSWEGLYYRDTRVLSELALRVDGELPQLLASHRDGASTAHHVHALAPDARGSPTALLLRQREVDDEVRERFEVQAFSAPVRVELQVRLASDFADLLSLRDAPTTRPEPVVLRPTGGGLRAEAGGFGLEVEPQGEGVTVERGVVSFVVDADPGRPWTGALVFRPDWERGPRATEESSRAGLSQGGGRGLRVVTSATRWRASVESALSDLHALHVEAPDLGLAYIGAGAPWFMALFGRDTVISAWEALVADQRFGLTVLSSLARFQGSRSADATGEQPGRILHELRTGASEVFGVESGRPYYGTVDAAPLFVMLLGELRRWGAPPEQLRRLLPAARAAVGWCEEHGDLDGDGYVEYAADADGLVNQGWKDSADAMVHADGTIAPTPIALAEVQAYLYAAYQALADLEASVGDPEAEPGLRARAAALRAAFQRDFWLPDVELLAMALDADKRPLAVASSNMGHCLWAGLCDRRIGDAVARRLARPDLSTSWGLRTLAASEAAYNPLGYHLGTIWPHDTAIAAAGLMRYGHHSTAAELAGGLLAAAEVFGWRLPELFAGLDAEDVPYPVPYPAACSPQAWSAAVPLLLLRTMLRLDPDVPAGRVHIAPVLPDDVELLVTGIALGGGTLDLRVRGSQVEVLDLPPGLEVVPAPRPLDEAGAGTR